MAAHKVYICDWCKLEAFIKEPKRVRPPHWGTVDGLILCEECWDERSRALEAVEAKRKNLRAPS